MRLLKRALIATSLLLSILPFLAAHPARGADPILEIEGVVTGVDGSIVSLLGGIIRIDATTAVITSRSAALLGIADVHTGAEISAAISSVKPDGTFVASAIVVGRIESVELRGAIESIDSAGGSFKLLGQTIATNVSTAFSGATTRGPVKSLADLKAEDHVEVTAVVSGSGLLALRVQAERAPEPPTQHVEFSGKVESIGTDAWVIAGRRVKITSTTEIKGSPAVGDTVKVEALLASDGTLTALEIGKVDQPPAGEHVEFAGKVESEGMDAWVISGRRVKITSTTEIKGSPAVGDTVKVEALLAADGTLTAIEIKKIDQPQADELVEFRGKVESKGTTSWVIAGRTVMITSATIIRGNPKVDDRVEVKARRAVDGTLTAVLIQKDDDEGSGNADD